MKSHTPNSEEKDTSQSKDSNALYPRQVALEIISEVFSRKRAFDHVLETDKAFLSLSIRDKAFVRMLFTTVLRRCGQIDDLIIRASSGNKLPHPPQLLYLLRMGAAQIVFMNVPDYAVVNSSVELCEQCGMGRQKGFVNAVLRQIAQNHNEWVSKQDETRLNTPEWLMKLWISDYDLRTAAQIAQANLSEAKLDISLKDMSMSEHWAKILDAVILPTGSLRCSAGGNVNQLPGFDDGMWWVQDASAALPALLFGDIEGAKVLDMCSAPGGKTLQLASMGAHVTAIDRSSTRLKKLKDNLKRVRLEQNVEIEIADASVWKPNNSYEYILLDAPCSATGTIRRHPDILHLKSEQDVARLCDLQKRLLDNAFNILKPGGVLVYCTCSLQKAEGEYQIDQFLLNHPDARRLPIDPLDIEDMKPLITEKGDIRILPFHMAAHGGMDGFYIARLQKISTI